MPLAQDACFLLPSTAAMAGPAGLCAAGQPCGCLPGRLTSPAEAKLVKGYVRLEQDEEKEAGWESRSLFF